MESPDAQAVVSCHPVRGKRWFIAASIGLVLFGSIHVLAVVKALVVEPAAPAEIAYVRAAKELTATLGPFHPTAWGTTLILSSSFSILLWFAGAVNLMTCSAVARAGLLRRLTLLNIITLLALVTVCLAFQFPPPAVVGTAVALLFVISWVRQPSTGS